MDFCKEKKYNLRLVLSFVMRPKNWKEYFLIAYFGKMTKIDDFIIYVHLINLLCFGDFYEVKNPPKKSSSRN